MKLLSSTALILSFCSLFLGNTQILKAQSISEIVYPNDLDGWIELKPGTHFSAHQLAENYPGLFHLNPNDYLVWQKVTYDEIGYAHHHYQRYHKGIPVEHLKVYIHEMNGRAIRANGFFPRIDLEFSSPGISPQQAIEAALSELDAEKYLWEMPGSDSLAQAFSIPTGSFYPSPQLMFTDSDFKWDTQDYRLAYKMEIITTIPHGSYWVYIDANDGSLIKKLNTLQHIDKEGTAETKFHGTQTIITDSTENGYRLREYSRASQGIETFDLNNSTNLTQAADFYDADNYWDSTNAQWDEVATDVHWGMEKTYDYFHEKHQRDSYDGNGGKIMSFVHFDDPGSQSAFWNVYYAGFGDNNGFPHVGVDVVGHEFTHGVIRNSAGNLIYIDEGGALNEGYADIFGNAVQYYVNPDSFDWRLGEATGAVRSLANPNSFQDPDTYKGVNWYTGDQDNGGAHTNANVLGHWFYLLSEGGSGVNDLGNSYQVTGISIEHAARIAYRNLTVYMTPTSQFADARQGMIQSAIDLYGKCSPEMIQTINAWYAVGLGEPVKDNDLTILDIQVSGDCQFSGAESVTISLANLGCADLPPGTYPLVYFIQNPPTTAFEQIVLTDTIRGWETLAITFSQTADLSLPKDYQMYAKTLFAGDTNPDNNDSPTLIVKSREAVQEHTFTFENSTNIMDSLIFSSGENASIQISDEAGNESGFGILMEGGWGFDYRMVESFPLWGGPPVDVFQYNSDFDAKVCMCVDATQLDSLQLQFDLKQHYSDFFAIKFDDVFGNKKDSVMRQNANNLRITANGEELARFQPTTQKEDTFATHRIDLEAYLGNQLNLCFQGRMIWDKVQDFDSIGDRIFIDNIQITSTAASTGIKEKTDWKNRIQVFPNPSEGIFYLSLESQFTQKLEIEVVDLTGRIFFQKQVQTSGSAIVEAIDLSSAPSGFYMIGVKGETGIYYEKVVKN